MKNHRVAGAFDTDPVVPSALASRKYAAPVLVNARQLCWRSGVRFAGDTSSRSRPDSARPTAARFAEATRCSTAPELEQAGLAAARPLYPLG